MAPKIKLLCELKRYAQQDGDVVWLLGVPWMPWSIVSANRCAQFAGDGDPDYDSEADDLQAGLPGGLEVIGAWLVSDRPDAASRAFKMAERIRKSLQLNSHEIIAATGREITFCSPETVMLEIEEASPASIWDCTSVLHSQMQLYLSIYTTTAVSDLKEHIHRKIKDTIEEFASSKLVFLVESSSKKIVIPFQTEERLADTFPVHMSNAGIPNPLVIRVLRQQCGNQEKASAPVVQYTPSAENTLLHTIPITLNVLCLVATSSTLAKLKSPVLRALSVHLESMGKALCRKNDAKLHAYHFLVPGIVHPVTAIYDATLPEMDEQAVLARKKLHSRLGLPMDRPLLRIANALTIRGPEILSNNFDGARRLLNVHIGLPRCGISGGRISLVDGSYEYYHYLQDRIDDKGWGCAYRSLQTIVSWFRLQHYTSVSVPSHREIQTTLVEIGDKEPSFIGSREWIGAIELSFVLDKLLGVTSRILNVRSGADLPEKCRELAAHFDTQGTPVMIGGGVLAYTLLGVDYNEQTGESAFLILDPHYTGGEDLKTIRNGGWCGWKKAVSDTGQEFFLRSKFYNLLLPQRPQSI